jgi:hypothetical protein
MRLFCRVLVFVLPWIAWGQEYKDEWLKPDVRVADAIVIGKLTSVWTYPWLDGWHNSATISIERVLLVKEGVGKEITFTWIRGSGRQLLHPNWSNYNGVRGVWILKQFYVGSGDDTSDWTKPSKQKREWKAPWIKAFAGGFLPVEKLENVIAAIQQNP